MSFSSFLKTCIVVYAEYFETLKDILKALTNAHFKVCSYFAWISDFQLHNNLKTIFKSV